MDRQLRQLISDIETEFNRLSNIAANSNAPNLTFGIGNLVKAENDAPPKVVWASPSGQFDPAKGAGGILPPNPFVTGPGAPQIATIVPRMVIWIWGVDDQACWDIYRILAVAIRNKCAGPNTRWREFQEPGETTGRWMDDGAELILTLDIDIAIVGQVTNERALRAVTRHTYVVSLGATVGDSGSNPLP